MLLKLAANEVEATGEMALEIGAKLPSREEVSSRFATLRNMADRSGVRRERPCLIDSLIRNSVPDELFL